MTADVIEECEYDEDDRLQLYDGDEEDKKDMMNPWQLEQCEELLWECCNSHYFSTGCIPNCDVTPEKASTAMEANKREQDSPGGDNMSDNSNECAPTPDWRVRADGVLVGLFASSISQYVPSSRRQSVLKSGDLPNTIVRGLR